MTSDGDIARAAEAVETFFERVLLASLELPDGWFGGRRGENLHELTLVSARRHRLLLELDGQLLLSFSGAPAVDVDGDEVVLSNFDQLVFDWQSYGQLVPGVRVFDQGTVRLVGQ